MKFKGIIVDFVFKYDHPLIDNKLLNIFKLILFLKKSIFWANDQLQSEFFGTFWLSYEKSEKAKKCTMNFKGRVLAVIFRYFQFFDVKIVELMVLDVFVQTGRYDL